jgi:hypothetical protein
VCTGLLCRQSGYIVEINRIVRRLIYTEMCASLNQWSSLGLTDLPLPERVIEAIKTAPGHYLSAEEIMNRFPEIPLHELVKICHEFVDQGRLRLFRAPNKGRVMNWFEAAL